MLTSEIVHRRVCLYPNSKIMHMHMCTMILLTLQYFHENLRRYFNIPHPPHSPGIAPASNFVTQVCDTFSVIL